MNLRRRADARVPAAQHRAPLTVQRNS